MSPAPGPAVQEVTASLSPVQLRPPPPTLPGLYRTCRGKTQTLTRPLRPAAHHLTWTEEETAANMCCSNFLRFTMIVFNFIIFLAGAAILGVGIWVKVDSESLMNVLEMVENAPEELNQIFSVGYVLIAVGAVLVLMGFLGCCGAIKESPCMLLTFFVIVLLVFIAEVAGAIMLFVFKPLVEELINKLGTQVVESFKKDYGKNEDLTGLWNSTMSGLHCCGFYNYTDFTASPFNYMTGGNYPDTCCQSSPCTTEEAEKDDLLLCDCRELTQTHLPSQRVTGCYPKLVNLLENNAALVGGVAIGIAAFEISGLLTLGLGLWIKYGTASFVGVIDSYSMQLTTGSHIYMGGGSIIVLIGFVGLFGAMKENHWLILLFFFIMTSLFIAEIVGIILVLAYTDKVDILIREAGKKSLLQDYMGTAALDPISEAWNVVMLKYKCCGFVNRTVDFENSVFSATTGLKYPNTCCTDLHSAACDGFNTTDAVIHPQGCFTKLVQQFHMQTVIIGIIAAGIFVIQVGMSSLLSVCVCHRIL
ncbi:tetraspanin-1-like isoform X1 [Arapaima gigas]